MGALLTHLLPGGEQVQPAPKAMGQEDPFGSGIWPYHREEFLGNPTDWVQDPALVVLAPKSAEDATHVPVLVDVTALPGPIQRIVVTIDYSPSPHVLTYYPTRALPLLGFGVKLEMASAIRASAQMTAGHWVMGGAFVDALGGGCTAPAAAHARADWQEGFGELRGRLWADTGRLRFMLRHPMDTGLADNIPAHHLTHMTFSDDAGEIGRLEINFPVEENPSWTFLLPKGMAGPIRIEARDNNGFRFKAEVTA